MRSDNLSKYQVQIRRPHRMVWRWQASFDGLDEAKMYTSSYRGLGYEARVILWSRQKKDLVVSSLCGTAILGLLLLVLVLTPSLAGLAGKAFSAVVVGFGVCVLLLVWSLFLNSKSKALRGEFDD